MNAANAMLAAKSVGPWLVLVNGGPDALDSPRIARTQDELAEMDAECERATAGECDLIVIPLATVHYSMVMLEILKMVDNYVLGPQAPAGPVFSRTRESVVNMVRMCIRAAEGGTL